MRKQLITHDDCLRNKGILSLCVSEFMEVFNMRKSIFLLDVYDLSDNKRKTDFKVNLFSVLEGLKKWK